MGIGRDKNLCKSPLCKDAAEEIWKFKSEKKMSEYIFAPSAEAVSISLKNPKTLENKMPKLLVKIALNIGFFIFLRDFNKSLIKMESLIF